MKLLITTQAVDQNDPALAFFLQWVSEFAKHCEQVTVVCLREGKYTLPDNVRVVCIDPSRRSSRISRAIRFISFMFRERASYDTVFVHMNPEYLVLGGWYWRLRGIRSGLWYTHRSVDLKLRIATLFANIVFTASPEGFRLKNDKVCAMGHGIDTDRFHREISDLKLHKPLNLLCVGRITPIKDQKTAVEALALLKKEGVDVHLTFIGVPSAVGDDAYAHEVKELIAQKGLEGQVTFAGAVTYDDMPKQYENMDFSLNLCPTGGLDKVVFESMAAGVPTLVANTAFANLFGPYKDLLVFRHGNARDLAMKIEAIARLSEESLRDIRIELGRTVWGKADVSALVTSIVQYLI